MNRIGLVAETASELWARSGAYKSGFKRTISQADTSFSVIDYSKFVIMLQFLSRFVSSFFFPWTVDFTVVSGLSTLIPMHWKPVIWDWDFSECLHSYIYHFQSINIYIVTNRIREKHFQKHIHKFKNSLLFKRNRYIFKGGDSKLFCPFGSKFPPLRVHSVSDKYLVCKKTKRE